MRFVVSIFFIFVNVKLTAQEKTFEREYTYKASEMDSKLSCRAIAINQLQSMLLNEVGVYVESENLLKTSDVSGKFSQDFVENIATISAGITKLQILEESWNGDLFWMKASITIDEKSLEESLKQLVNDRQKLKELEVVKRQLYNATRELDKLRHDLNSQSNTKNSSTLELSERYNNEIKTLVRADYFLNAKDKFYNNDYLGAIQDFSKAIEVKPDDAYSYCNRGLSKANLGDYEFPLFC